MPRRSRVRILATALSFISTLSVSLVLALFIVMGLGAQPSDVSKEIQRLELELTAAIEQKDFTAYERLVSPEYIALGARGEQTRAEIIETYRSGALTLRDLRIDQVAVHAYGDDTAVLTARTTGTRVEKGVTSPNRVRYMRVWQKRDGRWRAIAQSARPAD